jgi:outer membrane protein OmpA-like peptidoglycan-associated protein
VRWLPAAAGLAGFLALAACSTTHAPVAAGSTAQQPVVTGATPFTPLGAVEAHLRTALAASAAVIEREGAALRVRFPVRGAFVMDQLALLPDFTASLDALAHVLRGQEQLAVIVTVYTDATGSESFNLQQSLQRAQAIGAYLAERGLAGRRVEVHGAGESQPLPAEDTPEGRDLNRRVEISISALSSKAE